MSVFENNSAEQRNTELSRIHMSGSPRGEMETGICLLFFLLSPVTESQTKKKCERVWNFGKIWVGK